MLKMMATHYLSFLFVGIVSIAFAVFLSSYHRSEALCDDTISTTLILVFLIARIHTLIRFLSDLFVATGREGTITERLYQIADRLEILTIVAPVTWCWTGVTMKGIYIVCGMVIASILPLSAGYIYSQWTFTESE